MLLTQPLQSSGRPESIFDLDELTHSLRLPAPENCPPLVLIVGPCRSGSSALLQAMSCAGYDAWFQPLKLLLRRHLVGEPKPLIVPEGQAPIIFKETLGPFLMAEADFDPLALLLRGGYPAERISLVVMAREPVAALASWRRSFATAALYDGICPEVFETAYQRALTLYRSAPGLGVFTTAYVPEVLATASGAHLEQLFDRLGLQYRPEALDWSGAPKFGSGESRIVRDSEPMVFRSSGSLRALKASTRYEAPPVVLDQPGGDCPIRAEGAYEALAKAASLTFGRTVGAPDPTPISEI